ncbi:MAG: hypothetical protein HY319_16805 [Armatimonadetes bacterium]|nr:hypothetical protein [Armatimonadota bacterium]
MEQTVQFLQSSRTAVCKAELSKLGDSAESEVFELLGGQDYAGSVRELLEQAEWRKRSEEMLEGKWCHILESEQTEKLELPGILPDLLLGSPATMTARIRMWVSEDDGLVRAWEHQIAYGEDKEPTFQHRVRVEDLHWNQPVPDDVFVYKVPAVAGEVQDITTLLAGQLKALRKAGEARAKKT